MIDHQDGPLSANGEPRVHFVGDPQLHTAGEPQRWLGFEPLRDEQGNLVLSPNGQPLFDENGDPLGIENEIEDCNIFPKTPKDTEAVEASKVYTKVVAMKGTLRRIGNGRPSRMAMAARLPQSRK